MNTLTKIFTIAIVLIGAQVASAGSPLFDENYVDHAYLDSCSTSRGTIELRKADNGDLSIKFNGLSTRRCSILQFVDVSSGRVIKHYPIGGTSYTLSKRQAGALNDDCRLGVVLKNRYGRTKESYTIDMWWCLASPSHGDSGAHGGYGEQSSADRGISFQVSGKGNCKLMYNNQYQDKNVSDAYCQTASKKDVITYDYSRKGNCKIMKNGRYIEQNTSARFCEVTLRDFQ